MEAVLTYKKFNHDKTTDELYYDTTKWIANLEFMNTELSFAKHLIKSFPFKNKMLNLFERVQLFIKNADNLQKEKDEILDSINKHKTELNGMIECNDLYCDSFYVEKHEKIAVAIFNFEQKYRAFKSEINNYIEGAMD